MAHYCLQELHILPSKYVALPCEERAFIIASCLVKQETEEKARKKSKH